MPSTNKIDVLNYDIYMDGKQEREFKAEQRAKKDAALKIAKNKKEMKTKGAARAAAKLSSQTNLSKKQMRSAMSSSKTIDPHGLEGTKVTPSEMRQSERNLDKLDRSNASSSSSGSGEKADLSKYEKTTKQSKTNTKGIESGSGEGGSEEVEDAKRNPPTSADL
mgnify:CR=1 FL=1